MWRNRHHHLDWADPVAHAADSFAEDRGKPGDLAAAAARQHHDNRGRRLATPRLLGVGPELARLLDNRMTDIAAWRPAELAVHIGLERQQREDVIDVAPHRAGTGRPPGPD